MNNKLLRDSLSVSVLSILLFLLNACHGKNEGNSSPTKLEENKVSLNAAQLKNSSLQIGKLEQKNISSIIKLNGQIDVPPQNMVSVSMPLGGYLKSTKLLPGMHVSVGEAIATMEDQQYIQLQQDYLTTKNKLFFAEKEYQRQKELNQNQASSDKVFQQADNEFRTLKIMLSALAEKLRLIHVNPQNLSENNISKSVQIYSPINGFVTRVNVNIGKYVNPSDILFELVNPSDIHLNLKVFEKDLNKLAVGQKVIAYNNNNPQKYTCSVILISKDLVADHSADVHCHFENYDKTLVPGMYMNAEIELKNMAVACLPEDAVVNYEGKNYIFIVANNPSEFTLQEVETGVLENGFIEIKNASNLATKSIVTQGAYTLLMKMKNKSEE